VQFAARFTQALRALLATARARTMVAMAIRRIPHPPRPLTEPATAMGRITAAAAIHPTAMLAPAIPLMAMLATAILLMATATALAIASPAGWRFIEPAGAEISKGVGRTQSCGSLAGCSLHR
jgi:hypothetical protein